MDEKKPDINTDAEKKRELKAFMEDYNKANNLPEDITDNITHEDFVVGVQTKKMGIKSLKGEPNTLLYGSRKTIFNIYVMLYMIAPPILVFIWIHYMNDWWLLTGIIVSYAFTFFATFSKTKLPFYKWLGKLIIFFSLFSIGYWFKNGFHIHDYLTFLYVCAFWGNFWFHVAESSQNDFALETLIENKELFYSAIAEERIMIIKVRETT